MEKYKGYQKDFLGKRKLVPLPVLSEELSQSIAPVKKSKDNILRYLNYSVVQSATRKFPILTAANINGKLFKKISRKAVKGSWRKDRRIAYKHQWGNELYRAPFSDFDKGHMTKREDVQWSRTVAQASLAAKETFYFTNAVPQHKKLNQRLWRKLEDYLLHSEAIDTNLKINVFTGPVLDKDDPYFVTEVRKQQIKIPRFFWKVIYYTKKKKLYHVGFLAGQEDLLYKNKIVERPKTSRSLKESIFMDFENAETYQVEVNLLRQLTGMNFLKAKDLFVDHRPQKLVLEEVSVRGLDGNRVIIKGLQI